MPVNNLDQIGSVTGNRFQHDAMTLVAVPMRRSTASMPQLKNYATLLKIRLLGLAPARLKKSWCSIGPICHRKFERGLSCQLKKTASSPAEARQAEPGPSVLWILSISTGLAVLILGVVWLVFFPHLAWNNSRSRVLSKRATSPAGTSSNVPSQRTHWGRFLSRNRTTQRIQATRLHP
jgi:hypothetical protein